MYVNLASFPVRSLQVETEDEVAEKNPVSLARKSYFAQFFGWSPQLSNNGKFSQIAKHIWLQLQGGTPS